MIDTGRDGFQARLNDSLKRFGLSQSALARRVQVKRATVNAWVQGRRTPDLETTRKLAAIFNWPIPEMLSWFGIYEPLKQNVDKKRQTLDTSAGMSTIPAPAGMTAPGIPPAQPTSEDPQKELVVVPSPDHRALYALLATLSTGELQPIASIATDLFLRHFGGNKERKAEGD